MKFILTLCILLVSLQLAFACRCVQRTVPELTADAAYVFQGKVTKVKKSASEVVYTVDVVDSCKTAKKLKSTTTVVSQTHTCGVTGLEKGKVYNFFTDENLQIQSCLWDTNSPWKTIQKHCKTVEPCICDKKLDLQCGKDGITYSNTCMARCAGVDIAHKGECKVEEPPAPETCICPHVVDPVCGKDGMTYGNACKAFCADVKVAHKGECKVEEPPAPEPENCICAEIYDPVCGKDRMTYSNKCRARCAGVKVAHKGECKPKGKGKSDCPFRRYKRYRGGKHSKGKGKSRRGKHSRHGKRRGRGHRRIGKHTGCKYKREHYGKHRRRSCKSRGCRHCRRRHN